MAPGWGRSHSLPRPEHRPCLRAPRAVHSWAEGASGRAGTAPGAAPSAGGGRGCGGTWARAPRNGPETPRVLPETPEGKPHPRHPAPPHRAAALVHARYPRAVPSARGHPRHGRAARAHTRAEPAPPPSLATCVPSAAPPRPRPQRRGSQRAEARGASRRGMDPPAKEGSLLVQHSHKFGTKVGGRPARPSRRAGPGRGGRGPGLGPGPGPRRGSGSIPPARGPGPRPGSGSIPPARGPGPGPGPRPGPRPGSGSIPPAREPCGLPTAARAGPAVPAARGRPGWARCRAAGAARRLGKWGRGFAGSGPAAAGGVPRPPLRLRRLGAGVPAGAARGRSPSLGGGAGRGSRAGGRPP